MLGPEEFHKTVEARTVTQLFGRTASIAVLAGNHLLMGKRRDNGKWTLPGGGLNEKELPLVGAFRELLEETGLAAPALKCLGHATVTGRTGRMVTVYAYLWETYIRPTRTSQDPDQEVEVWEWIDITAGIPAGILRELQSPKNVTLQRMGLL
jgi:8-oxo-dGTP pyrophosphatase MutT (NUDIX family)